IYKTECWLYEPACGWWRCRAAILPAAWPRCRPRSHFVASGLGHPSTLLASTCPAFHIPRTVPCIAAFSVYLTSLVQEQGHSPFSGWSKMALCLSVDPHVLALLSPLQVPVSLPTCPSPRKGSIHSPAAARVSPHLAPLRFAIRTSAPTVSRLCIR